MTWLSPEGWRRARRLRLNRKHRLRDRHILVTPGKVKRRLDKYKIFNRTRTATATGYGVAYEWKTDARRW